MSYMKNWVEEICDIHSPIEKLFIERGVLMFHTNEFILTEVDKGITQAANTAEDSYSIGNNNKCTVKEDSFYNEHDSWQGH